MNACVSVVILVYNAEKYIERCAQSLFEQTLRDIEYIFVDDCGNDSSMEILGDILLQYPERKDQVKIIRNDKNMKQAYSRTISMQAATGEFITYCDSDDWVDTDLYENMYNKARETQADIVTCDIKVHMGRGTSEICSHFDGSAQDCLQAMAFNSYGCNKLISRDLINRYSIYPFAGINCGEDLNVIVRALAHAGRITYIPQVGYHYWRNNEESITSRDPLLNFEQYLFKNIDQVSAYLTSISLPDAERVISFIKLNQRGILLWATSQGTYKSVKAWTKIWPETNKFITEYPGAAPKQSRFVSLFCTNPFLLWCFVKSFRYYVRLRSRNSHK